MVNMFKDKIIMITGGTGSFGKTVLKRLLDNGVGEVRVFSRDEKKQEDMRLRFDSKAIKFYIGDVRDCDSLISASKGADYIFHAAALKQVPSCEFYPMEAVRTNVLGTENVLNAAIISHVKKVVLLSTDKAVYPINAMGASKALAEKLLIAKARNQTKGDTKFCITRYGNVMGSRGSVIPLFISQARNGKPLTITDSSMSRFLMTLEDSVDLVFHAFTNAEQGDIFVKKADACTLGNLAKAIIEILNSNSDVITIGTRHGEKLFESLISREEMIKAEDMGRYFRIPADNRDMNYSSYFTEGEERLSVEADYTSHNTIQMNVGQIKKLLLSADIFKKEVDD